MGVYRPHTFAALALSHKVSERRLGFVFNLIGVTEVYCMLVCLVAIGALYPEVPLVVFSNEDLLNTLASCLQNEIQ